MNFFTNNYRAKTNLLMIKIFTKQYLKNELTDKEFKAACMDEVQNIIDMDLESAGTSAWLYSLLDIVKKFVTRKKERKKER